MLAKLPGEIRVKGSDDVTEKYLLLSDSHDGTSALRVFSTPIRVVCANTLSMAHREGRGQGVSVVHKGDLAAKVAHAQRVLGLARHFFDDAAAKIEHLASVYPTARQVEDYVASLYPDSLEGTDSRARNIRAEPTRLFEEGLGQDIPETRHTAWAAYNAVAEYVGHHRMHRGGKARSKSETQLGSAWFGNDALLKAYAWSQAVAVAL